MTTVLKSIFCEIKVGTQENEKLHHLGNELDTMRSDYEEMKRMREEAKKQLESRFDDVHR